MWCAEPGRRTGSGHRRRGAGRSLARAPALQGHVHAALLVNIVSSANFTAVDVPERFEEVVVAFEIALSRAFLGGREPKSTLGVQNKFRSVGGRGLGAETWDWRVGKSAQNAVSGARGLT